MSLKKYFIIIYKLRKIKHCFVLSIKYVGCDLIGCNWQMFVSIKFTLIPVNRINKMHLVCWELHYQHLTNEYKHPGE